MRSVFIISSLFSLLLFSCNNNAGWTQEDKDKFKEECIKMGGANAATEGMDMDKFCSCALDEMTKKYKDPSDIGSVDIAKIQEAVLPCMGELMGGMESQLDSSLHQMEMEADSINSLTDSIK